MAFRATADSPRAPVGFFLLIALLALCAGGKAILYDTLDPDCFWHLRVAEQLHRDGIGPIVDHLSFASSPRPWTPYSWLAELGMKAVWDLGGYRAAVAVQALMQAAIIIFLALSCLEIQRQIRYLPAVIATAVGAYLSLAYFSFRPVTAAFVILSICTWLILRDRRLNEQSKAIWWIIPLTAVLTNIHLFAFFVPLAMFAMLIGAIVERHQLLSPSSGTPGEGRGGGSSSPTRRDGPHPNPPPEYRRRGSDVHMSPVNRYSLLLLGTTLAFFATPMLSGLLRTMFFYGSKDKMVASPVISEMQSFAHGPMGFVAAILVAAIITFAINHHRRLRIGETICFIAGTILLFKLGRFSPVFALAACPVLATTFPDLQDRLLAKPAICALLSFVLMVGSWQIARAFPRQQTLSAWLNRHGPDTPGYPTAAADFVRQNISRNTGKIINEFSWGGYLEWELGDQYQIFLDGRTQVFPLALWQATYLGNETDCQRFLSTLNADAAVVPANKSRFRSALIQSGWTSTFRDDRAEVLVPPRAVAKLEQ